jgi:hypothetical protein
MHGLKNIFGISDSLKTYKETRNEMLGTELFLKILSLVKFWLSFPPLYL